MPHSSRAPLVSAWLLKPVIAALRARVGDVKPVLEKAGLSLAEVEVPNAKLPRDKAVALLEAAVEATADPSFGLAAAELYQPGANVFDYAGVTSPTIGAALTRVCRYARLVDESLMLRLEEKDHLAKLIFEVRGKEPMPPVLAEYVVGVGVIAARHWVGFRAPLEAHFRHAQPEDMTTHERVLRGQVRFGMEHDAIIFPKIALAIPLRTADPDLLPVLDAQASRLLATSLREALPLPERVRQLLRSELEHGNPTTERVAERLKMSERTLRRRLAEHQTSLKEILDSLRRELSLELLGTPNTTIEEVALRLGFSDATAFHRAFRRWTGKTPGEHLRRG
jgi:AraC-like DNA-binding protein